MNFVGTPKGNKLNCGSGQRPFNQKEGWINIDIQERWKPDLVADWNDLAVFEDTSMDIVVSHHSLEHIGCGEATGFIREAWRVLKPEGSLLVFVPDMRALAQRWLMHQIDDYTFFVNTYGAYMGDEADRHKWNYSYEGWLNLFMDAAPWKSLRPFDWRPIPGADLANDWWILSIEAIK